MRAERLAEVGGDGPDATCADRLERRGWPSSGRPYPCATHGCALKIVGCVGSWNSGHVRIGAFLVKPISDAATELGISEDDLRTLVQDLNIPVGEVDGDEAIEITPLLRLAVTGRSADQRHDSNWKRLVAAIGEYDSAQAGRPGRAPLRHRPEIPWLGILTFFATAAAAAAAFWAVGVAKSELGRAVDAFKLGNQYTFESDVISALEPFLLKEPEGVLIVADARIGLGYSLQSSKGFPKEFWSAYRYQICSDIKAHICPDEDSTAYLIRISNYENITQTCYPDVSDIQEELCELEVQR